jgi:hypothetical protein
MTQTLTDTSPTARKAHSCSDCGRTIQPGEKYRRWSGVGDDGVYTWKSCAHCDKVASAIWASGEGPSECDGLDVREWLTEYELEPLATQMREHWRGVAVEDIDTAVLSR